MILVDHSDARPEANLALDEALLRACDDAIRSGARHPGFLRFWESARPFVVLGVSRSLGDDVDETACAERGVPILRRSSGGGTVVQGPGCWNFAVVVPVDASTELAEVQRSYRWILERSIAAFGIDGARMRGSSDLALGDLKFGGSAQKRTPRAVLHHATVLHAFDLALIAALLREPSKRPDYRGDRRHGEFLLNVSRDIGAMREGLIAAWSARPDGAPLPDVEALITERYGRDDWTRRFP